MSGYAPLLDNSALSEAELGSVTNSFGSEKSEISDPPESGLSNDEAQQLLKKYGYNELATKEPTPCLDFLKNFWGPMPIMIWIAIIVELVPKPEADHVDRPSWADFAVLLTLQIVNGLVGWYEHKKAGDAVAALKQSLSPRANVKRNGQWVSIPGRELVPGDLVSLAIGGAVPADCRVLGPKCIYCDQAALTGESLPAKIDVGDYAKMGSTVSTGECDAVVTGTGDQTFFGKTAKLIVSVEEVGHFEKILYKITAALLGLSLLLTGIIMGVLISTNVNFLEVLAICVVLLVASIPIAMNVVCTSTMAIGSRKLAGGGAIVTRLGSIEELAGMDMLCSDKTGTLTLGQMKMADILIYEDGMGKRDILKHAALAAKWYEPAKDAIDRLVLGDVDKTVGLRIELDTYDQLDYTPFDPSTKKTSSVVKERKSGKVYEVAKGAPQVVLNMCVSCDSSVREKVNEKISELADRGIRSLGIARNEENDPRGWVWLGILTFTDPPRHDTKDTIEKANALGIEVKMITGDQVAIARETCFQLGMGTNIRGTELIPGEENTDETIAYRFEEIIEELNGFAEVFPEHKYKIVETFRKIGYRCGMTGDGVNDAPALKRADIGIAVQGATDAARAAADIVLTEPGLGVIIDAIYISRKIFKRMKNYVTYRIACTIQLLLFFFVAVLAIHPDMSTICLSTSVNRDLHTPPVHYNASICKPDVARWAFDIHDEAGLPFCKNDKESYNKFCKCEIKGSGGQYNIGLPGDDCNPSYFKIPVIALVLITILNDGTIISIAYDNVKPSSMPEQWNLLRVCITSTILGVVACASTLTLLFLGMDSGSGGSSDVLNHWFGLPPLSLKQLECLIYLKISLSDFLTVFAARTNGFFFTLMPGKLLMVAFCAATFASTLFAATWPFGDMEPISGGKILF